MADEGDLLLFWVAIATHHQYCQKLTRLNNTRLYAA